MYCMHVFLQALMELEEVQMLWQVLKVYRIRLQQHVKRHYFVPNAKATDTDTKQSKQYAHA